VLILIQDVANSTVGVYCGAKLAFELGLVGMDSEWGGVN
jgi:hypothetical protein